MYIYGSNDLCLPIKSKFLGVPIIIKFVLNAFSDRAVTISSRRLFHRLVILLQK